MPYRLQYLSLDGLDGVLRHLRDRNPIAISNCSNAACSWRCVVWRHSRNSTVRPGTLPCELRCVSVEQLGLMLFDLWGRLTLAHALDHAARPCTRIYLSAPIAVSVVWYRHLPGALCGVAVGIVESMLTLVRWRHALA